MIGDRDPEDAYDAGDTPAVRVAVLERVATALEDDPDEPRRRPRARDALRVLVALEATPGVDRLRVATLRDRLEWSGEP